MSLVRVLHAEMLKMKRTIALKMVVLCPALVVLLILFAVWQTPFTTVNRRGTQHEWAELTSLILKLWAGLMMPLFITLEAALIAGLDHSENQWKSLFARPVPRWTFYVAKLIVIVAMTAASSLLLAAGIVADGAVLPRIQSQVVFGRPVPWGEIIGDSARIACLAFLPLTIQYWVSMRWRSFAVAIGAGIMGIVVSFVAIASASQTAAWPQYFPWALPMLILAKQNHNLELAIMISLVLGLLVGVAGCLNFVSREIS
jgi:hypothetical protein